MNLPPDARDEGPAAIRNLEGATPAELAEQVVELQGQVDLLLRRIADSPKHVRTLEERLLETRGQLNQAVAQNEKLTYTLREARDHISRVA